MPHEPVVDALPWLGKELMLTKHQFLTPEAVFLSVGTQRSSAESWHLPGTSTGASLVEKGCSSFNLVMESLKAQYLNRFVFPIISVLSEMTPLNTL